ncbi:hypothetical protein H5185_20030 [Shewanella sp. SG44-6]|uniref:hypothetical protein n=1 Tax=Shewanella sp. SG44-6 TaxID=2760959 RepID=UPI0016022A7C|nr:hypothetical protein [Shewanella sp. SG44-6]MBB1391679.1 hypothetical protein [Shewanella sp. SG44-6]
MDKLKQYYYIIVILITLIICWSAWPVVSKFTAKEIQPIASAVSTLSGILFGFVMASISLFASAKDNKLVRNTTLTGYLPKLVNRLHVTMGLLLFVCFTFLLVLFIPDSLTFTVANTNYKYSVVIVIVGIFLGLNSFVQFYMSWRGFKDFSEHM